MKSMRALAALLLAGLLALPISAWAQGGEDSAAPAAAVPTGGYTRYSAEGYGFALALPGGGAVRNPQSGDWQEDPEVAFEWTAENTPIVLITGRVDTMDVELNDERFKVLCDTMLDTWKQDAEHIRIETSQDNLVINNYKWNLIEIADSSSADGTVYFSVFTTYRGNKVYTVSMYYLQPVDKLVRDFGKPVLQGFSIQ
ncbi:hypothetical protein IT575_03340 [bacterium]|nr:hypothetical protein [bacterium]